MKEAKSLMAGNKRRSSGAQIQVMLETEILKEALEQAGYSTENQDVQIIGRLNPSWVEIHMGFPSGWTKMETRSTQSPPTSLTEIFDSPDSVTQSFLKWLNLSRDVSSISTEGQEAETYE
jgi:hypothetical protein